MIIYYYYSKTQLVKANIITAKEFSDVPMSKKSDTVAKKLNTLSEYNLPVFNPQYPVAINIIKVTPVTLLSQLDDPYINSPGKPPNTNC